MATSASSGATVLTEQLWGLAGTSARYVKFIGIGNSSSTNWTSIANVNIYGYDDCTNACDYVIYENSTPIPNTLYKAEEIYSEGTVDSPDVDFEASDFILLNSGFEVLQGADFDAVILPCY